MILVSNENPTNIPKLGGTYSVPPSIICGTLRHLESYTRTEAVCFWLGRYEFDCGAIKELWIPKFRATAVSYDIAPLEMLRLKAHLDNSVMSLQVQVHSHPGDAFHSEIDDHHAASPWKGFVSIVVPDGGRITTDFWNVVQVYELEGGGVWRHIIGTEKRDRFVSEDK